MLNDQAEMIELFNERRVSDGASLWFGRTLLQSSKERGISIESEG
jgi:hypothetical protein